MSKKSIIKDNEYSFFMHKITNLLRMPKVFRFESSKLQNKILDAFV